MTFGWCLLVMVVIGAKEEVEVGDGGGLSHQPDRMGGKVSDKTSRRQIGSKDRTGRNEKIVR